MEINEEEYFRRYKVGETFVYDLTAEGHSKAMVIDSDFKMTSRHELTFLEVDKEQQWWRFRLRELSNKLVKYDDATVAQIIEATNEISAIYEELDFWVSDHGILRKINNRDQVYSKWEKVREYLTYKYPMSSYEIILAKEKELANEPLFMNNIRYMHFMYAYFLQFGKYMREERFKHRDIDRFGSCIPIELACTYKTSKGVMFDGKTDRHFKGDMIYDGESVSKILKNVDAKGSNMAYQMRANFHNDGEILEEANLSLSETVGKDYSLYTHLHLKLHNDGE